MYTNVYILLTYLAVQIDSRPLAYRVYSRQEHQYTPTKLNNI